VREIPSFHTQSIDASAYCPEPKHTFSVLENGQDKVGAQAVRVTRNVLVVGKGLLFGLKSIDPFVTSSYPKDTVPVLIDRRDVIATQAVQIIGIVSMASESVGLPAGEVKFVETAAASANPQRT
jgi:hypothetical protein